jgi:hypothetical protein
MFGNLDLAPRSGLRWEGLAFLIQPEVLIERPEGLGTWIQPEVMIERSEVL